MNDASPTYDDDEINLAELAHTLWDGKWLIAAITAVCVVFAGAFALLAPKSYSGSLELRPIPLSQSQQYNELNSLDYYNVTPALLRDRLIEDLSQRRSLVQAIKLHSSISKQPKESDEDFSNRLLTLAYHFKLIGPVAEISGRNNTAKPHWTIEFSSFEGSAENLQLILKDALSISNKNVQELQNTLFQQAVSISQRSHKYRIEDLELSLLNQREDYEKKVRNRVAFLDEQAKIARSLGIAKNTIEAQTFQSGTSVVTNVTNENPFYLRGYEAIEKEENLLKTRKGVEAFISELIEIENKKRAVRQDQTIQRAKTAFHNSPLVRDDFLAAFYDIASIEFKSNIKPPLILALALVGGGFLAIVVVLIRSGIRKYKKP